jgi:zinc protease
MFWRGRFWALMLALVLVAQAALASGATTYSVAQSPGGLAFLYRFDDTTTMAAVNFGWRDDGSVSLDKAGLPSLIGALLIGAADHAGGTAGSPAASFTDRLKELGAAANLSGGPQQFRGLVRAPPAHLAEAMTLTAAALKTAVLPEPEFARLIQQAISAETAALTRIEVMAQRALLRLGTGVHPASLAAAASRFDVLKLADIADWRRTVLTRSGLKITVSGQISADDAGAILDRAFGDLPDTGVIGAEMPLVRPLRARTIVIERETAQSTILIGGRASLLAGPPEQLAAVANGVLGGDTAGRIWQAVRIELGASFGGHSGFHRLDAEQRLILLSATIANDQLAPSLLVMRRTYADWYTDGISQGELRATVNKLAGSLAATYKDPARINALALDTLLAERPIADLHDHNVLLQSLTVPDINDCITTAFPRPEQMMTVIVTPSAARLIEAGITTHCVIRSLDEIDRCKP